MNILIAILALALGQDYPDHVGVVNDFANEIDKDTKAKIEKAIEDVKTKADIRLVVVTIPSLQGQTVEAYTVGLARKWGVGQKGKNNGILFLHAPKERKIRIENGYGVESRLTDIESKTIIEKIIPLMKAGKFSEAMLLGTQEIDRVVTAPEKEPEKQSIQMASKSSEGSGDSFAFLLMIVGIAAVVLILILVMVHSARPPPRERYVYSAPPKPTSPPLETDPLRNSAMGIEGLTTAAMLGMVAASQSVPPSTPLPPPTAPVAPDPTLAMMLLEEQRRHREEEERRRKRRREEEEEEDRSRRRRSDDSSSSSSSSWDSGSSSSSSDSFSGGDFGGGGSSGDY